MRFAVDEEQQQLGESVGALLTSADVPAVARAWAAGEHTPGLDLLARLDKIGLGDLADHPVELVVVFEELGRHAVPGPVIETYALGLPASPATVAWAPHLPNALDADVATPFVVVDDVLHEASVGEHRQSVDPTRRLFALTPTTPVGPAPHFDRGVVCQAAQLLGLGRGLLEQSAAYVTKRTQFGRPVGEFQAVKHQLADVLVALELARPLVFAAAVTGEAVDVSGARIAAADAAHLAARAALQVHGAVGFTQEHDLSLSLLKVRASRAVWGTQAWHRRRVLDALTSPRSR